MELVQNWKLPKKIETLYILVDLIQLAWGCMHIFINRKFRSRVPCADKTRLFTLYIKLQKSNIFLLKYHWFRSLTTNIKLNEFGIIFGYNNHVNIYKLSPSLIGGVTGASKIVWLDQSKNCCWRLFWSLIGISSDVFPTENTSWYSCNSEGKWT